MTLTALDYAVICAYLVAIVLFGSWFARFQKTTKDYFLTGPVRAVVGDLLHHRRDRDEHAVVHRRAGRRRIAGNMTFLQLAAGYVIGRILVSALFIPAYFRGDLFTSYELLQRRFGHAGEDDRGRHLPGHPVAGRRHPPVRHGARHRGRHGRAGQRGRSSSLGIAMIVYTVRGGVSAVIWTDVVQMFVYVAGALIVFAALLARIPGGWAEVVRGGQRRRQVRDPRSLAPTRTTVYTLWAGLVGGVALTLATHGTDQFLVQRLLAGRSARQASLGPRPERLHRLRAVRAVPGHRRDAVHVLPARAARRRSAATTRSCRASSSPPCPAASPGSSSRPSSRRRCRRR